MKVYTRKERDKLIEKVQDLHRVTLSLLLFLKNKSEQELLDIIHENTIKLTLSIEENTLPWDDEN